MRNISGEGIIEVAVVAAEEPEETPKLEHKPKVPQDESFTQKTTQDGPPRDTRTCLHSIRAGSTGNGGNLATNVMSHQSALGGNSPPQDQTTETGTSLQTLTQNKFIICYTTLKLKKYRKI